MIGGGNSYDIYLNRKNLKTNICNCFTSFSSRKGEYVKIEDLLMDRDERHQAMELGIERLEDYFRIEKHAKEIEIKILKKYFPELENFKEKPLLWVNFDKDYPSETKKIDVKL